MEEPQDGSQFSMKTFWSGKIWPILRWILLIPVWFWVLRLSKWVLIVIGFLVMTGALGFVFSPEIISGFDALYPEFVDMQLGIDRSLIMKLHEPGYFAEQTEIVSEKQEAIACISD